MRPALRYCDVPSDLIRAADKALELLAKFPLHTNDILTPFTQRCVDEVYNELDAALEAAKAPAFEATEQNHARFENPRQALNWLRNVNASAVRHYQLCNIADTLEAALNKAPASESRGEAAQLSEQAGPAFQAEDQR